MTDPFSDAREAFVKMDDVEGRLLLITVTDDGERESNLPGAKAGDMYTYVVADVAVLDGDVTDMIDEVPMLLEDFQLTGDAVTGQLLPALKKLRAGKGTGMVLGRLGTKPNKFKTKTWIIQAPTEQDKVLARKWIESEKERAAKAAPVDPFAEAAAE